MNMNVKVEHLSSLLGRIFIIALADDLRNWNGNSIAIEDQTDYESLGDFISFEEGDLTSMKKKPDSSFYIYFSFSSKVEVFKTENGFVICDGLFFNKSWDYSEELFFNTLSKIDLDFEVFSETVYVFDATLEGKLVLLGEKGSGEWQDRLILNLSSGIYSIYKVESNILIDGQEIPLKGIMLSR